MYVALSGLMGNNNVDVYTGLHPVLMYVALSGLARTTNIKRQTPGFTRCGEARYYRLISTHLTRPERARYSSTG